MEMRLLLSLLVVTLSPGAASADSIQSAAAQVSAAERGTVTLSCSYNTSYNAAYYLYWYRQYPNRTLQYLLYRGAKTAKSASSTADFARDRFSSETVDTSTEMKITALELGDTAVYHCALQLAQRDSHTGDLHKNPPCLHTRGPEETGLQVSVRAITPPSSGNTDEGGKSRNRPGRADHGEAPWDALPHTSAQTATPMPDSGEKGF